MNYFGQGGTGFQIPSVFDCIHRILAVDKLFLKPGGPKPRPLHPPPVPPNTPEPEEAEGPRFYTPVARKSLRPSHSCMF